MVHEQLYDAEFMAAHREYLPAYAAIADTLVELGGPGRLVDVGCGHGFLVMALRARGVEAVGLEGSAAAAALWPRDHRHCYRQVDLTSLQELPPADLVATFEVAEHLPPERADAFVALLTGGRPRRIFFSAATPGQTGTGHVNEQPHRYWIRRFAARGYRLDVEGTVAARRRWSGMAVFRLCWWYPKNFLTFVPARGPLVPGRTALGAARLARRVRRLAGPPPGP